MNIVWRDIRGRPITIASNLPIRLFSQVNGMSFRTYHILAYTGKHLNTPIGLDIHPKYSLCFILSDASANIAEMIHIIPLKLR